MTKNLLRDLKNLGIVLLLPALFYLFFFLLNPTRFGNVESMFLLLQQSIVPTITSMGLFYIIVMGLFDFSIGSILVMSAMVGLKLSTNYGYVGLILGCLITAVLLEATNGALFSFLKIPSLIITVGMLLIYEPVASFLTPIELWMPAEVDAFGRFPMNMILGIFILLIAYFIYNRTRFGIYAQAIGQSEIISQHMGVSPARIKFLGFVMCGFFVGFGALALCSFMGGMVPQIGMASMSRVFTPMIGCFIGITLKKYCNVML